MRSTTVCVSFDISKLTKRAMSNASVVLVLDLSEENKTVFVHEKVSVELAASCSMLIHASMKIPNNLERVSSTFSTEKQIWDNYFLKFLLSY